MRGRIVKQFPENCPERSLCMAACAIFPSMSIRILPRFLSAVTLLSFVAWTGGCVRRDGRNSDCRWPEERGAKSLNPNSQGDARHLREDVSSPKIWPSGIWMHIVALDPGNLTRRIRPAER